MALDGRTILPDWVESRVLPRIRICYVENLHQMRHDTPPRKANTYSNTLVGQYSPS